MKHIAKIILAGVLVVFLLKSCMGNRDSSSTMLNPLTNVLKKHSQEKNLSVILYDMDALNPKSSSPDYMHKYQILIERPDTVLTELTPWTEVPDTFFNAHINDLGMELLTKKDGVLKQQVSPAGYSNYIGNERYGHWTERNGSSFWEFYGKYRFMSSLFGLATYPARRDYWYDYDRSYRRSGRAYYGPTGQTVYGTKTYANNSGSNKKWNSNPTSFKQRVRSKVAQSSSRRRTSRSASRSSSNTSYRSRSRGFGK